MPVDSMFKVDYQDRLGEWHYRIGGFLAEDMALEAAKDISEEMRTKTRIVHALSGQVRSVVEVLV